MKDGQWILPGKMEREQRARDQVIYDLIVRLVSGEFNLVGPRLMEIDAAIAQCDHPRATCPVQALLVTP